MFARIRVIAAWLLFAAWVSWLGWQSMRRGQPVVVSRAQLIAADIAVVAEVSANTEGRPLSNVKIVRVVWPASASQDLARKDIAIENLPGCDGFGGAGRYVLILAGKGDGPYRLAQAPRSPLTEGSRIKPAVYPEAPSVLDQLHDIPGPSPRSAS